MLTLKMHGTSGRTGYLPLVHIKKTWLDKLLHRAGKEYKEYGYITGTRRVVLDDTHKGGFYESDDFRHAMAAKFEGKLHKGEVVYYEIVGFQGPNGAPIMGQVQNSKVKDPEFTKQYGAVTTFAYGCDPAGTYEMQTNEAGDMVMPPCCEVYVYRMTMVNEDGDVTEYSPAQIKERCEQMGVHTVMEFETFIIPKKEPDSPFSPREPEYYHDVNPGEYVTRRVERYFDGPDPIGHTLPQIILSFGMVALAALTEHVGDMTTASAVTGYNLLEEPGLHRTLLGDGLGSLMGTIIGGQPNTTYSEYTSTMAISGVYSTHFTFYTALVLIALGFIAPFNAFLMALPNAVFAGVSIVAYGMIALAGLRTIINGMVDFTRTKNQIIFAAMITTGLSGLAITAGAFHLTGIALAMIVGVILNLALRDHTMGWRGPRINNIADDYLKTAYDLKRHEGD